MDRDGDLLAEGTLPAAWSARWLAAPEGRALASPSWGWVTNGELDDWTARVASRLRDLDLSAGDRIVVSGPTSVELVVAHVGALRAGLTVVPVNPNLTRSEFEALLAAAQPRAVLGEADLVTWADEWADEVGDVTYGSTLHEFLDHLTEPGEPDPWGARPPDPSVDLDTARPDDVAILAFTSGTTGRPKGVPLSHANLLAGAEALRRAWAWTPDDCLILSLPLFHMHGLGVGVHGTLLAGASAALVERFEPEAVLHAAAQPETTMLFGVPTMYARLVDAPGADRLADLRLCVSGSAPLSAELHRRIHDVTGQVVLERYGMTETVMLTSNPLDGERRPGTVGPAAAGRGAAPRPRHRRDPGAGTQRVRRLPGSSGDPGAGSRRGRLHRRRLVPHR